MTDKPGYVKLLMSQSDKRHETNQLIKASVNEYDLLSPDKLANRFMGELQQCLKQCQQEACQEACYDATCELEQLRHINDRIKLRRHGPAVQMDVMDRPATATNAIKIYSVDMVPTIEISSGELYVAKPIKETSSSSSLSKTWKLQNAWRRSFSMKEKERLATLDGGNGCRKQVLRVLKVIRNREAGLTLLTSYHLKTVLFRKIDELPNSAQWRSECLGQRLMDVICQLEKELDKGDMPHYFLRGVNLLDGMTKAAVFNMRDRLKRLKNREQEMMRLLQSSGPDYGAGIEGTSEGPRGDTSNTFQIFGIFLLLLVAYWFLLQ